jgi:hypothetical protein
MNFYDKIEDVESINPISGLYLFTYTKYNKSYCKIGMTSRRIHERLYEYRYQQKIEPTKIVYAETLSYKQREKVILNFLKYKNILPIKGREYLPLIIEIF